MKNGISLCAAVALTTTASAGVFIDQNQPSGVTGMASTTQLDLAQSFQTQSADVITGAGVFILLYDLTVISELTISLWDNLPSDGGNQLASGVATVASAGVWADASWGAVAIDTDTTYYLVFESEASMVLGGDTSDPYAFGNVFANPGFQPFESFDYAFRTFVPTPGAAGLLGVAGLAAVRRRR